MRRGWALAGLLGLTIIASGCAHRTVATDRFEAEYNCKKSRARNIGGTTYVVQGCGHVATYTCGTGRTELYGAADQICIREADPSPRTVVMHNGAPTRRQKSAVERRYDEKRKLETVVGTFTTAPNVSIVLAGAPGASLGEVIVELRVPRHLTRGQCTSLEVLVNAVPNAGAQFTTSSKGGLYGSQARYDFQTFKPLAKRFSTLASRACGYEAKIDDQGMDDVQKFFVIYSQIASELVEPPPQPVPTGAQEL
jgi:hypothetical protein